jgi:hypothetical protein
MSSEDWPIRQRRRNVKIRIALAAVAAAFIVAPTALAQHPVISGTPAIFIGGPEGKGLWSPPAVPHVGDTLYSSTPSVHCDPSCDPNNPDANPAVGNRELFGGTGPAGLAYQFERCDNPDHCIVVQARSTTNTYVVQPSDAGFALRVVFMATNLDCSYPRSYDQYQHCAWDTRYVPSDFTPAVPQLPVVAVSPVTLPDGVAATPYTLALTASNGTGPYSYSVRSGSLPPGLSLSAGGALTGTPTTGGSFTFAVQASASGATPGTRTYTLTIALAVAPATLPAGTTGVAYNQPLTATGATATVTFGVATGSLPPDLALTNGVLNGTPTQKGTYAFTVKATDASGAVGTAAYSVVIGSPTLTVASTKLPKAVRGVAYTQALAVFGGSSPYTFAPASGQLPAGLRLRSNGTISGVPTSASAGTYAFDLTVTDRYGAQATFSFTLVYIARDISIEPARLGAALVGSPFNARPLASGGRGPYSFEVVGGTLPPGITLRRNGTLSGVAKHKGTFRFKLRATDQDGAFGDRAYVLVVKG